MCIKYKNCLFTLIITMSLLIQASVWASSTAPVERADAEIITSGLMEKYAHAYPQIRFMNIYGEQAYEDLSLLPLFIGFYASSADYEHPPEIRQQLLEAQVNRIVMMVDNRVPSATLFKNSNDSLFPQAYTCVLTMDESYFTQHALASTEFMAGETVSNPQPSSVLDNNTFIRFTLEHEIFHCLDAYLNGPPQQQTLNKLKAGYYQLREEQRADVHASLALLNHNREHTGFISQLIPYRSLSMSQWDVAHYSAPVLQQLLDVKTASTPKKDINALVNQTLVHADQFVMSFADYTRFLMSVAMYANSKGMSDVMTRPEIEELLKDADNFLVFNNISHQDKVN